MKISRSKITTVATLIERLQQLDPQAVLLTGFDGSEHAAPIDISGLSDSYGVHVDGDDRLRIEDYSLTYAEEVFWFGWDGSPEYANPPEGFRKVKAVILTH